MRRALLLAGLRPAGGVCGLLSDGATYGTGYDAARGAIEGQSGIELAPLKFIANTRLQPVRHSRRPVLAFPVGGRGPGQSSPRCWACMRWARSCWWAWRPISRAWCRPPSQPLSSSGNVGAAAWCSVDAGGLHRVWRRRKASSANRSITRWRGISSPNCRKTASPKRKPPPGSHDLQAPAHLTIV